MTETQSNKLAWGECLLDGVLVALFQLMLIVVVRAVGFSAISDDDYARLVIAQEFVDAPSWDPSGTSWLPLPFLITGGVMTLLGTSLTVGFVTQHVVSGAAAALLYLAARFLGAGRLGGLLGVALACAIPSAAFSAAAAVPAFATASLITFGAVSQRRADAHLLGGACLFLACASRYEAWAAGLAYCGYCWLDAQRNQGARRWSAMAGGSLAILFPAIWILHGVINHESAIFFIKRVTEYKAALGDDVPSWLELARGYPWLLFVAEPEITFTALFCFAAAWAQNARLDERAMRPYVILLILLLSLVLGASRGGAPTHHPERALLSIWLTLGLSVGKSVELAFSWIRHQWVVLAAVLAGAVFSVWIRHQGSFERQRFATREAEQEVGQFIRKHYPGERIALLLPDYGYFAVMAAAGAPKRFIVLDSHDPRTTLSGEDPLSSWLESNQQENCTFVTDRDRPGVRPRVLWVAGDLMLARSLGCPLERRSAPPSSPHGR